MKLARATFFLATVAFVAMLAYTERRRFDSEVHERYVARLVALRAVNARLNETVLKVRVGLTPGADQLNELMREATALHVELHGVPSFLPGYDRERIVASIDESARAQKDKHRQVGRFVAEDAALIASLRFLSPETAKVAADLETAGARSLADHARTLHVEVLELAAKREQGHHAAIEDAIDVVLADNVEKKAAQLLVAHVRNVVRRRTRVDALTDEIVTNDGARIDAIDRAAHAYSIGVDAARSAGTNNLYVLFALALAMLGSASAYAIARLRASKEELGAATVQLTQAMAQLQAEREKEKELAELKTRFVAMTSHEFRTPLSVISSSAELLQSYGEKWAAEKRGEHLARIRRSVTGMTTMLDRILLIGKTEAGMLQFLPSSVALDRLCLEIAHSIELADGGKRRILSEVASDVGVARADEKLVRHVLENLLSNAVKYSPEGASVRFSATRDGDDVVLMVADRGIGIPEEDRARLFDGFHRARNAMHISGTGLGLSVVKRAVELHGGKIAFDSVLGEGTTFTVRLRAEREDS